VGHKPATRLCSIKGLTKGLIRELRVAEAVADDDVSIPQQRSNALEPCLYRNKGVSQIKGLCSMETSHCQGVVLAESAEIDKAIS
jgi:hypothetical protein